MLQNQEIFLKELKPKLAKIEASRKAASAKARTQTIRIASIVTAFVLGLICLHLVNDWESNIFPFLIIGAIAVGYFLIQDARSPYQSSHKSSLGRAVMETLQPDWGYRLYGYIPAKEFKYTGVVTKTFDKTNGSHLVEGRHGETDFAYSFMKLQNGSGKNRKTVFEGLLLVADFHKNINGRTLVFPDKAQRKLGTWLGKKVQERGWHGLELVYLEDPVFEEQFVVYSQDQVEARYILTPSMMERMVALSQNHYHKMTFAFNKGKVCIAIEDLMPPHINLDAAVSPLRSLNEFSYPLELVKEIIDIMELNTRIWEKD